MKAFLLVVVLAQHGDMTVQWYRYPNLIACHEGSRAFEGVTNIVALACVPEVAGWGLE